MDISRRLVYGIVGALLSTGAPLGLLIVRLNGDGRAAVQRAGAEIQSNAATYIYVAASTAIVFTLFGALLGAKADHLAALANTDALTKLQNARALREHLRREMNRAMRYRQPLALLLIDVDRLKEVNDRFGHAAGDRALRHVSAAIRSQLRESDVGARWGGDEFALLAPGTPAGSAAALAERVRSLVARPTDDGRLLTASIGIATFDGAADVPTSMDELMKTADKALYDAKLAGRDCYVIGSPPRSSVQKGTIA